MEIIIGNGRINARAKCATCGGLVEEQTNKVYHSDVPADILKRLGTIICELCKPKNS